MNNMKKSEFSAFIDYYKYCKDNKIDITKWSILKLANKVAKHYIVQKKTWFGWRNLWPDFWCWGDMEWERTFKTCDDAENAIKEYVHKHRPDKVIKVLEI